MKVINETGKYCKKTTQFKDNRMGRWGTKCGGTINGKEVIFETWSIDML